MRNSVSTNLANGLLPSQYQKLRSFPASLTTHSGFCLDKPVHARQRQPGECAKQSEGQQRGQQEIAAVLPHVASMAKLRRKSRKNTGMLKSAVEPGALQNLAEYLLAR